MTLSEVVETAKQHNIPIRKSGISAQNKGFNQCFINDNFWKADEVAYVTTLMGVGSKVVLKIHPDWPRRVYEIEIHFTGNSHSQEFKSELITMLTNKYGRASRTIVNLRNAYRWNPDEGDEILVVMYSYPLLSYSDIPLKKHAQKQINFNTQNARHGYTKKDSGKF